MFARVLVVLGTALLLCACVTQPVAVAPAVFPAASSHDPQQCLSQAECTTKTARTLLFVFDYAAAGGALVERQGRELFTPAGAPANDWPAIAIHLAEPRDSHFGFSSRCQAQYCRYSTEQLLQLYRSYLDGVPCSLPVGELSASCFGSAAARAN